MVKSSNDITLMDLHSLEVDLARFDKLRAILRSRQQGGKHTKSEVLKSLEACMEEYDRVFADFSDRLSGPDMQLLKAEAASLDELIRAENEEGPNRERQNSSACARDPKSSAQDRETTTPSSVEVSDVRTSDLARNANDNSKHGDKSDTPDAKDVPAGESYEDGTQPNEAPLAQSPKRSSINGSSSSQINLPAHVKD
ncbi:hypothetical protein BST61_g778 [Cercospora zeina]